VASFLTAAGVTKYYVFVNAVRNIPSFSRKMPGKSQENSGKILGRIHMNPVMGLEIAQKIFFAET